RRPRYHKHDRGEETADQERERHAADAPCATRHTPAEDAPEHRTEQCDSERERSFPFPHPVGANEERCQISEERECRRLIEGIGDQDMPDSRATAQRGESRQERDGLYRGVARAREPQPLEAPQNQAETSYDPDRCTPPT